MYNKRLAGRRLLVIEDVAPLRQMFRSLLELEGASVVEASTGREAIELARTQTFDLALTDLALPDVPGELVIAQILAASRGRTPVVILSGAGQGRLAGALLSGAERAFSKPVEWNDLIRYLELCTGRRTA